jgi:hypothetical protein
MGMMKRRVTWWYVYGKEGNKSFKRIWSWWLFHFESLFWDSFVYYDLGNTFVIFIAIVFTVVWSAIEGMKRIAQGFIFTDCGL